MHMIFPTLKRRRSGYVNLDLYARGWLERNGYNGAHSEVGYPAVSPLLDPAVCQAMVNECHAKLGFDFSYGGWLEDRSVLWKGSYLKEDNRYIHLGIDVNAPAGTPVALDMPGRVVLVDNDHPLIGGWGTRVMIKLDDAPIVLIYAHLAGVKHRVGDTLKRGDVFAEVGSSDANGHWYTHTHVQAMTLTAYECFLDHPLELDGYGKCENIPILGTLFPDPVDFIDLE
jgi:murein DD-endopeptidase MepM/ murein hydrolase activator NlpD